MKKNLLLTGIPRVGKSTLVRKVVQQLGAAVGGFSTEEVRLNHQRVGFRLVALDTGEGGILAHVDTESPYRLGKYGVSVEEVRRIAVPALERALARAPLIIIDEIARMECFCPEFMRAALRCLESAKPVFGVIQQSHLPFLDLIRERDDVRMVEVTVRNRERLGEELVRELERLCASSPM